MPSHVSRIRAHIAFRLIVSVGAVAFVLNLPVSLLDQFQLDLVDKMSMVLAFFFFSTLIVPVDWDRVVRFNDQLVKNMNLKYGSGTQVLPCVGGAAGGGSRGGTNLTGYCVGRYVMDFVNNRSDSLGEQFDGALMPAICASGFAILAHIVTASIHTAAPEIAMASKVFEFICCVIPIMMSLYPPIVRMAELQNLSANAAGIA